MPTHSHARWVGALYLLPALCAPFSMMYVPSVVYAPGDAAATAARLLAYEGLLRAGALVDLAIVLIEIVFTAWFYRLLRPAGQTRAQAAAAARWVMAALQGMNALGLFAALRLAHGGPATAALALVALDLHATGIWVWQAVFALHCGLAAGLLGRARFFPRALAWMMGLTALGYALSACGSLLAPAHAALFEALLSVAALVGEIPVVLWMLVRGANEAAWRQQAEER